MRRLRSVILGLLLAVVTLPLAPATIAQDATPTGELADLGFPTLDVTVTADGYEGIPASMEAGRYLVTVTVAEENGEEGGGVGFIQPSGMSADEFVALLAEESGGADESGDGSAASSPIAEGDGEDTTPAFLFASKFAGGVYANSGQSSQIVLDLTPGEWVAWGDDPEAPWTPMAFTVTGEMPTDLTEPMSSATITLGEYIINVTEGTLVNGPQVIRVDNIGAQPHFIVGESTDIAITDADIMALLEADMTGTPAATTINPDTDFADTFNTGTQSIGTSVWVPVNLVPGNLLMLCFFPDLGDGMPHAYHGMYEIVNIPE